MDGRFYVPLLRGAAPQGSWRAAFLLEVLRDEEAGGARSGRPEPHTDTFTSNTRPGSGTIRLHADPYEMENLLHEPTLDTEAEAAELAERLDALRSCSGASCGAAEEAQRPSPGVFGVGAFAMIGGMRREEAEEVIKRGAKCIVCDEHRFAYLVVQKAASTSIKTALLPLFDGLAGVRLEDLAREDGTSGVHPLFARSPYQTNKRRFLRELERGRYEGYFVFAFVRNPWDRLLSCWKQKLAPGDASRGMGRYKYGGVELHKGMPFAEFVEAIHEIPDEEANPHFRSQHVAVCQDGAVLADFVGRFETLEEDFARVADRIGAGDVRLPHLTRSSAGGRQPYRRFYDHRLRRLVEERFGEDAEIFGYSF